jgi:hypothetical protein
MLAAMQVINEYKKARAVLGGREASGTGGVWQSLFQEVEKVLLYCPLLSADKKPTCKDAEQAN